MGSELVATWGCEGEVLRDPGACGHCANDPGVGRLWLWLFEKPAAEPDERGDENAQEDHRREREVELEPVTHNTDVAREAAESQAWESLRKKDKGAYYNEQQAHCEEQSAEAAELIHQDEVRLPVQTGKDCGFLLLAQLCNLTS